VRAVAVVAGVATAPAWATDRPWTNPFALTTPAAEAPAATAPQSARPRAPGVHVDRGRVGLGEALTITVIRPTAAPDTPGPTLDPAPLEAAFEVRELNRGVDDGRERWTLVAYPRTTGRFTLPRWGQPGAAPVVEVTDGGAGAPRVRLQLSADTLPLWQRRSVTLTLQACTDGALQWQRPVLPALDGALLRPLGESEADTRVDGLRCTATRWHWALLPTASGRLQIRPPTLQATRFGQVLRFPASPAAFDVAAVPGWLPAEVAVGPLEVGAPAPTGATPVVGEPWPLRLQVRGDIGAGAVRQVVESQLRPYAAWSRYPVTVEPVPDLSATPQWKVTVHALPSRAGPLEWPALAWAWFDPVTQQLRPLRSAPTRVTVDDPVRRRWSRAAGIVVGVLALALVGSWGWHRQAWRWRRWRLARSLRDVRTAGELRDRLLSFQLSPGQAQRPSPRTLGAWRRALQAGGTAADPGPWLDPLDRLLYGPGGGDGRALPPSLLQAVRRWLSTLSRRRQASARSRSRSGR
jgi:hypothetical protein